MLGVLRLRSSPFVDLCKEEMNVYVKSTVKQTVVEYVSQVDDDSVTAIDDECSVRHNERIAQLKIQEFLHLLARVLNNVRTMLGRIKVKLYS